MKKIFPFAFSAITFAFSLQQATAQAPVNVAINYSGASANPAALLDVSASDKGVLIPRVALTASNSASPVASPPASLMVYNTATAGTAPNNVSPGFYYWDGAQWLKIATASASASSSGGVTAISGKSSSQMTWDACSQYCYNLTESGYTDWRVPTVGELKQVLVNGSPAYPTKVSYPYYIWTSFAMDNGQDYWVTYAEHDNTWTQDVNTSYHYCRCVR